MADLPLGPTAPTPGSYDYPDPERDRRREAEASLREDRIRNTEAAILSTQGGREWLWAVLNSLNLFETRIAMSGSDFENGLWIGEQQAAMRMFRKFARTSPKNFGLMFEENDH